jgi:hypothetical protein
MPQPAWQASCGTFAQPAARGSSSARQTQPLPHEITPSASFSTATCNQTSQTLPAHLHVPSQHHGRHQLPFRSCRRPSCGCRSHSRPPRPCCPRIRLPRGTPAPSIPEGTSPPLLPPTPPVFSPYDNTHAIAVPNSFTCFMKHLAPP